MEAENFSFEEEDEEVDWLPLLGDCLADKSILTETFRFTTKEGQKLLNQEYLVEETELGEGSFSSVKKIKSTSGQLFALKVYNKLYLQGKKLLDLEGNWSTLLERAQRDLSFWSKLQHPNICRMLEVFEQPGKIFLYIRMEAGELGEVAIFDPSTRCVELGDRVVKAYQSLKEEPMTRRQIIGHLFNQMVQGVEYMHSQGVCHGDIKLENMVITLNAYEEPRVEQESKESPKKKPDCSKPSCRLMFVDFNSCKSLSEPLYVYEGTLHYSPPEAIYSIAEGYCGKACDVYALGVALYTLLEGRLPIDNPPDPEGNEYHYEMEMHMKIRDQPITWDIGEQTPAEPTPALQKIRKMVEGMLEKDPKKRSTLPQVKTELLECQW